MHLIGKRARFLGVKMGLSSWSLFNTESFSERGLAPLYFPEVISIG